jgi:hypothetical protein
VAGFPTQGGSGNGGPAKRNSVDRSYPLWQQCREEVEAEYPDLRQVLDDFEACMFFVDVQEMARYLSGQTWLHTTPEDRAPVLSIYFTYDGSLVTLRAVWAE